MTNVRRGAIICIDGGFALGDDRSLRNVSKGTNRSVVKDVSTYRRSWKPGVRVAQI